MHGLEWGLKLSQGITIGQAFYHMSRWIYTCHRRMVLGTLPDVRHMKVFPASFRKIVNKLSSVFSLNLLEFKITENA